MRAFILSSLVLLTLGCSGVSNVSYPLSDGTFRNQRTISDPHAFAPTQARSWIETCQPKADKTDEPDYTRCSEAVDPRYATVSGFADGIGAAVVHSAGFVGGMYLLGQGIGDSGSRTSNTTNTTNTAGGGVSQQINTQTQTGSTAISHSHSGRR